MNDNIKIRDFIKLVRRNILRGDKHLRLTMDEAVELQAELSLLLIDKATTENSVMPTTIHGGKFKS
jgi:hypothetical protein